MHLHVWNWWRQRSEPSGPPLPVTRTLCQGPSPCSCIEASRRNSPCSNTSPYQVRIAESLDWKYKMLSNMGNFSELNIQCKVTVTVVYRDYSWCDLLPLIRGHAMPIISATPPMCTPLTSIRNERFSCSKTLAEKANCLHVFVMAVHASYCCAGGWIDL